MNIFSILLEVTLFSVLLYALILLIKRIFRKTFSPSLQYFVWFLLLARLAIPVTLESGLEFFTIPQSVQHIIEVEASY